MSHSITLYKDKTKPYNLQSNHQIIYLSIDCHQEEMEQFNMCNFLDHNSIVDKVRTRARISF